MIKPYVCSKSKDVDRNLRKVRSNYEEMLGDNKLLQDSSSYYLYEQILPNKSVFRGLLGLTSVEDFWNGKIKNMNLLTYKTEKLAHFLEKVSLQAEPVLSYLSSLILNRITDESRRKNVPIINHTDETE